ncbi:MAG TPA: hypothetical protein VFI09_03555 [Solirubrobacterales bacterium]|nr:hypothetical protein [Solirubrobacterales bacterium]
MAGQELERAADLIGRAYADGELSRESANSLRAVGNIAGELGPALGVSGEAGDLLLVTILVDDSTSITEAPYGPEAVRLGHNLCLDVLEGRFDRQVLVHTRYLNGGSLSPFMPVNVALRLSDANYRPEVPKTPLHRQTVITLGSVMTKVRAEREEGRRVRAFTLLVTDGGDNASSHLTAEHVRFLVKDMLDFSDDYIVGAMGIGDSQQFRGIFTDMGVPQDWIMTPDATAADIERVFKDKVVPALSIALTGGEAEWTHLLEAGPPVSSD